MRVVFFLLAVCGLSYAAVIPAQPKDLNQDLQDFIDLIPTDEILLIVLSNLEDPEVQAVIEFIFSDEFKSLVLEVEAIPEYETLMVFLENTGLPVRSWIAFLHELIGLSRTSSVRASPRGLSAIIDQIIAILPLDKIKALYAEKLITSPDFKNLVDQIQSPAFKGFVQALKDNKRIQEISARLKAVGIDVDGFLKLIKEFFGFESFSAYKPLARDLNQDLQDFIDLIPTDEILLIVLSNLEDPEVQAVIEFIFSDEFKGLVLEVEAIPEYETLMVFLENTGLPVRRWVAFLHELIGLSRMSSVKASPRGLSAIIDQIIAILPLDKIKALYAEKLITSPDFKNLVDQIQSPAFKGFVQALKDNKRVQEIAARLKAVGIDVDGFLKLIKEFFGFESFSAYKPLARDLNQDLQDFIDLLPTDEIVLIILSNLEDPEVQAVIEFFFSDECKALVLEVEAIPEYEALIDILDKTGLPVREWIASLHELLGLSHKSTVSASPKSLKTIIDQILAIVPLEKIKALYAEKLITSPDFKNLIDQIQSPAFKGFVKALQDNKRVQEIAARLKAVGLDIDGFLKLIKEFFGFESFTAYKPLARDLNQDLQDFIDLLPTDEMMLIILSNLEDPEVQATIEFFFSDEFKGLVLEVEAIPEYETLMVFLENTGLPVRRWVAFLHELIGLSRTSSVRASPRGLSAIIDQLIAILPLDKIKALYAEKLITSPDFKNLVDQIQSPAFKGFVQALKDNKRVQEIAARLKAVGIDVDGFLKLIKEFFGFESFSAYKPLARDLNQDLQDFIDLLPTDEIVLIILSNLEDPEVQAVIEFFFSDECKALVLEVEAIPEYEALIDILDKTGLPVREWIASLHELLGLSHKSTVSASPRSLKTIIDQILAIVPLEKIKALYAEKLITSPDFKNLIDQIQSPAFKGFVKALQDNKRVQEIAARLKAVGLDIDGFLKLIKEFFGFESFTAYKPLLRTY